MIRAVQPEMNRFFACSIKEKQGNGKPLRGNLAAHRRICDRLFVLGDTLRRLELDDVLGQKFALGEPEGGVCRGERLGEKEALGLVAAQFDQFLRLFTGFDALHQNVEIQRLAERQKRRDERLVVTVMGNPVMKLRSILRRSMRMSIR